MIRKYCIYRSKSNQRLAICSIPVDDYHRSVEGTIAGGFISIDNQNCEITLSGKSEEFGRPTIEEIVEAIKNNGHYLEKEDKEYTWTVVDMLGERIVINKFLQKNSINDNTQNYSDDWQIYTGDYDKFEYDIITKEGKVYENCYPNAGKFTTMVGETVSIKEEDVVQIRFSNNPKMYLDNEFSRFKCKNPIDLQTSQDFVEFTDKEDFQVIKEFSNIFPERNNTTFKRVEPKIGRNDKCSCGSNKKYKNCHGK